MNSACVISGAVLGIVVALFVVSFVGDWIIKMTDHVGDDGYLSKFLTGYGIFLGLGAMAGPILGGIAGARATHYPLIATAMIIIAGIIMFRFLAIAIQLSNEPDD